MTTQPSPLDARIGTLRSIQTQIATLRDLLAELPVAYHPDVAAELRAVADALSLPTSGTRLTPARRPKSVAVVKGGVKQGKASPPESARVRMFRFFQQRSNVPATIAEIAEGLGIGETGIGTIVYRRNEGQFEKAGKQGGTGAAPATLWRLTKEALNSIGSFTEAVV
jgi:hypothetical protein